MDSGAFFPPRDGEAQPSRAEVDQAIRERVQLLPRGETFLDHVWVGPGLLVPERTLLESLGVDVSQDPPVVNPMSREGRRPLRPAPEPEGAAQGGLEL